jgi:serine/threonine protein kinase
MTLSGHLPSEDEIVSLCLPQETRTNGIQYGKDLWIKFGEDVSKDEVYAQMYAFQHGDRSIVSIPEVYHWFQRDGRTYILMEFIEGEGLAQYLKSNPSQSDKWDAAVSAAVKNLWEFPVPKDAKPGPLGGGMPTGPLWSLWRGFSVNQTFQSMEELESWINGKLQRSGRPERVNFSSERLIFSHGDLAQRQFIVQGSKLFLVDFGATGFYPSCFDEVGLFSLGRWYDRIRSKLFPSQSANLLGMFWVRRLNQIGFD